MEVEVAEHAELEGGIDVPVGVRLRYSDGVQVVEDEFHAEKAENEANCIGDDA